MRYIVVIIALCSLVSCSPRVFPVQRDTVTVTNTVKVVEYRDTILNVPVPPGEAGNSGQIRDTTDVLETSVAVSGVEIRDGDFRHWLRNKQEAFIRYNVKLPKVTVTTEKDSRILVRDVQYVEKELSGWQRTIMGAGYVLCALVLLYIAFKVLKWKNII